MTKESFLYELVCLGSHFCSSTSLFERYLLLKITRVANTLPPGLEQTKLTKAYQAASRLS